MAILKSATTLGEQLYSAAILVAVILLVVLSGITIYNKRTITTAPPPPDTLPIMNMDMPMDSDTKMIMNEGTDHTGQL